jgi:hypothetical protein
MVYDNLKAPATHIAIFAVSPSGKTPGTQATAISPKPALNPSPNF